MTQVTPPGWYPDPGQSADGPRTERWWDGNVWTDQVRAVGAAAGFGGAPPAAPPAYAPGAYPNYPAYPAYPGQNGPRRGVRTAIAIGMAVVVLAGIGGGVYFLTSDDGDGDSDSAAKSPSSSAPSEPGSPGSRRPRSRLSPGRRAVRRAAQRRRGTPPTS